MFAVQKQEVVKESFNSVLFEQICNWNFENVIARILKFYPDFDIAKAKQQYCCFIYLAITNPGKGVFATSQLIDDFWHTHILFTQDYRRFCFATSGSFLDHFPVVTPLSVEMKNQEISKIESLAIDTFGFVPFDIEDFMCLCQMED